MMTLVCTGGAESEQAELGTFERGAARVDLSGRHGEQSQGEAVASCRRGEETARTHGQ